MVKALVYGSMDPSSILAPFSDFLFFFPLYSRNFLSWERVSGITPLVRIMAGTVARYNTFHEGRGM